MQLNEVDDDWAEAMFGETTPGTFPKVDLRPYPVIRMYHYRDTDDRLGITLASCSPAVEDRMDDLQREFIPRIVDIYKSICDGSKSYMVYLDRKNLSMETWDAENEPFLPVPSPHPEAPDAEPSTGPDWNSCCVDFDCDDLFPWVNGRIDFIEGHLEFVISPHIRAPWHDE